MTNELDAYKAMQRRFDATHGATDWGLWQKVNEDCQSLCDECANFEESCALTGRVCPTCATWPIPVGDTTWPWVNVARALR